MKRVRFRSRKGYVMVLFAMLLFGLMALATLVIDLGFARLAQRQMNSSSDSAALEGLRGLGAPGVTFSERQQAAKEFVLQSFDDDLNPDNGDDGPFGGGGQYGTGPDVTFTDGAGAAELSASQLMRIDPGNPIKKPGASFGQESTDAFRVSIQRGQGGDPTADIYSEDTAIPFLFGRGTLMPRQVIARGLSTGARSRAEPRPAVRVGPAINSTEEGPLDTPVPGLQPVAFALDDWNSSRSSPVEILGETGEKLLGGLMIGRTAVLGDALSPGDPGFPNQIDYCAIYLPDSLRIIGFGCLGHVTPDGQPVSVVASRNATASLASAWEALQELGADERRRVLEANRTLEAALLAPILVRD